MPVPPERIQVGGCYLARSLSGFRLWKVLEITPEGLVFYEQHTQRGGWRTAIQERLAFAATAVREVHCDWTPTGQGAS